MYKEKLIKNDGRYLILYWQEPKNSNLLENNISSLNKASNHLRWNPVLSEWVGVATQRQDRTFFPPDDFCPLCVTKEGGFTSEIPLPEYELAVFQNKFHAFTAEVQIVEKTDFYKIAQSKGECEVVV